jgi:hypothetical protein
MLVAPSSTSTDGRARAIHILPHLDTVAGHLGRGPLAAKWTITQGLGWVVVLGLQSAQRKADDDDCAVVCERAYCSIFDLAR